MHQIQDMNMLCVHWMIHLVFELLAIKLMTYGDKSYSYYGPLWGDVTSHIHSFEKTSAFNDALKTDLLRLKID